MQRMFFLFIQLMSGQRQHNKQKKERFARCCSWKYTYVKEEWEGCGRQRQWLARYKEQQKSDTHPTPTISNQGGKKGKNEESHTHTNHNSPESKSWSPMPTAAPETPRQGWSLPHTLHRWYTRRPWYGLDWWPLSCYPCLVKEQQTLSWE